jgi:hypothetical protein
MRIVEVYGTRNPMRPSSVGLAGCGVIHVLISGTTTHTKAFCEITAAWS